MRYYLNPSDKVRWGSLIKVIKVIKVVIVPFTWYHLGSFNLK